MVSEVGVRIIGDKSKYRNDKSEESGISFNCIFMETIKGIYSTMVTQSRWSRCMYVCMFYYTSILKSRQYTV